MWYIIQNVLDQGIEELAYYTMILLLQFKINII